MTDTNQLREAFEVRMTDGGKWPAAVERGRGGAYRLAQTENAWTEWQACAESLQARAQVQGEPFGYIHHFAAHDESGALIDTTWEADGCADPLPHPTFPAMWKWSHCTPFYTTPQPAQATQAEAKQPATGEPVWCVATGERVNGEETYTHHDAYVPLADCFPLYTYPAPGVPDFSRIAKRKLTELQEQGFAITGYAIQCDTVRGFIDVGGFVGWWQGEPAPGVPDAVVRNAERWRYAIADGGNQSMNFIDIFDDWDGDGDFVEVFDAARIADKKGGAR